MKIETLISVSQKGAHRFLSLLGEPTKVRRDVYSLYNMGIIQEIPAEFEDLEPFSLSPDSVPPTKIAASLKTNEYRLKKFAEISAKTTIAAKGRAKGMKMKEAIEKKTVQILDHLKTVFAAEKCPFGASPAPVFAMGSHGRAGSWEE